MTIYNADLLVRTLSTPGARLKFVTNDRAVAFFPYAKEHRDTKVGGLSYEHNHEGNAVAGIVMPNKVEIRFHSRFSDERIRTIWSAVQSSPELAGVKLGPLYYQGRKLE